MMGGLVLCPAIPMTLTLLAHLSIALLIGASLGFFGGLFGIGGGIIAVPLFALGFGMDQALAQGTALVLMAPNLLLGWWRYHQRHPMPVLAIIAIALSGTLTTWLVARVATRLDPQLLRWIFSGFLALLALRLLISAKQQARQSGEREDYGNQTRNLKVLDEAECFHFFFHFDPSPLTRSRPGDW